MLKMISVSQSWMQVGSTILAVGMVDLNYSTLRAGSRRLNSAPRTAR
jgi:hypothetical protein